MLLIHSASCLGFSSFASGFGSGVSSGSVTGDAVTGSGVGDWVVSGGNRFNCLSSRASNSVLRLAIALSLSYSSEITPLN